MTDDIVSKLQTLCHPASEFLPDGKRLTLFIQHSKEAADEITRLRGEVEELRKYQRIAAELSDKFNGTPCAEIRWQQELDAAFARAEAAERERDYWARARNEWEKSAGLLEEENKRLTRERDEAREVTDATRDGARVNTTAMRKAVELAQEYKSRAEAAERERDWHKALTQSHDLLADNAAQKTRADAAEAAMFDLLRENNRLAKSRGRWGQRYNKILLQLRAAVMTDTDYIKAVNEACENALVERDAAVARAEAADEDRDEYKQKADDYYRAMVGQRERAEAAEAKVAKLREALKPFAEALEGNFAEQEEDHVDLWESPAASVVTYGDLRRARTALQETEQ